MASEYKLKMSGERTHPSLAPLQIGLASVRSLPTLTSASWFQYRLSQFHKTSHTFKGAVLVLECGGQPISIHYIISKLLAHKIISKHLDIVGKILIGLL